MAAARRQVAALRPRVDALIAVTHLVVHDDVLLVEALPEIDLVLGGHEHANVLLLRGARLASIAKADAHARTVYSHDLAFHAGTRTLSVESRVRRITAEVAEDPAVVARVKGWVDWVFATRPSSRPKRSRGPPSRSTVPRPACAIGPRA